MSGNDIPSIPGKQRAEDGMEMIAMLSHEKILFLRQSVKFVASFSSGVMPIIKKPKEAFAFLSSPSSLLKRCHSREALNNRRRHFV